MNLNDWKRIHRAVTHARDTAFMATGDKNHEYVKGWEELMTKVQREIDDEDDAQSEARWQARMGGDMEA